MCGVFLLLLLSTPAAPHQYDRQQETANVDIDHVLLVLAKYTVLNSVTLAVGIWIQSIYTQITV